MKTLQTGTKVLIEATVDQLGLARSYVTFKDKSGIWLRNSDLTVCETAQPISEPQPIPSFKAGQEVEWISVADDMPEDGAKVLCYSEKYNDSFTAVCHNKDNDGRFEFSDTCFYWAGTEVSHWMPLPTRPIPAQPTVESELTALLNDHIKPTDEDGYTHSDRTYTLKFGIKTLYKTVLAWHQKHSGRVEVRQPKEHEIRGRILLNMSEGLKDRDASIKACQYFLSNEYQNEHNTSNTCEGK